VRLLNPPGQELAFRPQLYYMLLAAKLRRGTPVGIRACAGKTTEAPANIDDRRGGGMGLRAASAGLGIGGMIVLTLIGWALGIDPRILIGGAEMATRGGGGGYTSSSPNAAPARLRRTSRAASPPRS
jgi:hypothetical protein